MYLQPKAGPWQEADIGQKRPWSTKGTALPQLFEDDRMGAWYDGSAICVIAVGSHGDPLDLSESEVEALIAKLQESLKKARS